MLYYPHHLTNSPLLGEHKNTTIYSRLSIAHLAVLFNVLSLNTINSNIQIFSPRFGDTRVSGHFLTRRAVLNILAITVTTLLLPRPLSVVWKVLTSGCHRVVTIMGCHHVVTSPVSRLAHVSRVCVMSCEQRQK